MEDADTYRDGKVGGGDIPAAGFGDAPTGPRRAPPQVVGVSQSVAVTTSDMLAL